MRVSARIDYAVRAMCELAARAEARPVKGDVVASAQGIPVSYLENILHSLRRTGLIASQRGADGGYWLARPATEITVADVIRAVEGPLADVRGVRPDALAFEAPAARLADVWLAVRASLRSVLEAVTIADIVAGTMPVTVTNLLEDPEAYRPH